MPTPATKRNRKARQQAKNQTEAILAAAAAGTLVGTGATAPAAATASFSQQLAAAGAESAKTATTVGLLIAALAAARGGVEWLVDVLKPEFPTLSDAEIAEAAEMERQREADFIEAMRFRLNRDLPEALKQTDPDAAVAALLEREQRYMEQHDDATAARVQAFIKRGIVRELSPEGAFWVLDPLVKEHTPDCVAIAAVGWWPWSVLDRINPPVHTGCQCDLLTKDEAIGLGYIEPDEVFMGDDEARLRMDAISRQYDLGEGWRNEVPVEGESPHELMELRWNRRYGKGTIWGGRFMPRRGGFAPRISIKEIIRALDGPNIDIASRGGQRTVSAPDMASPAGAVPDVNIPEPGVRLPDNLDVPADRKAGKVLGRDEAISRSKEQIAQLAERRGGSFGEVEYFTMPRKRENVPSGGGGRRPTAGGGSLVFIGEKEQRALQVVADKMARGKQPTTKEMMDYWNARRLVNHETIHNMSALRSGEYETNEGYAMEEALTEELAQVLTADQLSAEGATEILRARALNPNDKYALGVYRPQREGLATVFEYGKVPEEDRREIIERLASEVDNTEDRIKILAGFVAEAQDIDEQRAIDIVRGAMFDYGSRRRLEDIQPGGPGVSVLSPEVDTIDPSLGYAYGDEVTVDMPDGKSFSGRVIGSGVYDGEAELKVEMDERHGLNPRTGQRVTRYPLVSQVRGTPEDQPERDASGMVRPDAPEAPDDAPQGEVPDLAAQTDALMRGEAAGGPTLRPEEQDMLEMASPALLDKLDDGEGPVETAMRQALNAIGVDPYDLDIAELTQHAEVHEGAPKSRATIAGRGASVCANSRMTDFAVHVALPEMLREKYPDLAEILRATSPRWGRRQDEQMPLGLATPEPEMASPGSETPEAQAEAIDVGDDVQKAADLMAAGYRVQLDQPRSVSILLDELRNRVQAARDAGEDAPNFDLCDIYIPGTNLFCSESKGIPRNQMPQLSGVPIEGSPASRLEAMDTGGVGEEGIVDIIPQFRERLAEMGVEVTDDEVPASHLRASQTELNGSKVAGIAGFIEGGGELEGAIIVSSDDYVVDGHHRWAAKVGVDTADGVLGDVPQEVIRVDMPITELLELANEFATEMGIPQADVTEDRAAARRELAAKGELPDEGAPEMSTPSYDDQAVERMTEDVRSGRIGRFGAPLLVSGVAKERAAADGKDYDSLSTEEKRTYIERARDEFMEIAISREPDSELQDLVDDPRLGPMASAELERRSSEEVMASPSEIGGTPFRPEDADDPEGFQRKLEDYERRFAETAEAFGIEEMANREQQGVWNGEPEPSVATDLGDIDEQTAVAAAAIMGRRYNQDAMAVFAAGDEGPGGRFAVRIPEGLSDQELLDKITEGMPEGEGASILDGVAYFYAHDYDTGVGAADSLAAALDSEWQAERGTFTLISDEDYGDITYEQAIGEAVGQARDLSARWDAEDRDRGEALDTGSGEGNGAETAPAGDPRDPRGDAGPGDAGAVAPEPAMASPDVPPPSAELQARRDAVLDEMVEMASPDYQPGPNYNFEVLEAVNDWQRGRLNRPENSDALVHAVTNGRTIEGPLFRGQPPPEPSPERTIRSWSDDLDIAIDFALSEGAVRRGTASEQRIPEFSSGQGYDTSDLKRGEGFEVSDQWVISIFVADSVRGLSVNEVHDAYGEDYRDNAVEQAVERIIGGSAPELSSEYRQELVTEMEMAAAEDEDIRAILEKHGVDTGRADYGPLDNQTDDSEFFAALAEADAAAGNDFWSALYRRIVEEGVYNESLMDPDFEIENNYSNESEVLSAPNEVSGMTRLDVVVATGGQDYVSRGEVVRRIKAAVENGEYLAEEPDPDQMTLADAPVMASPAASEVASLSDEEAADLIVSSDFFALPFDAKLELVDKLGLDEYPGPGPVGRELLGGAENTQAKYKSAEGNSYTPERNVVHSKIKGMLLAGYVPEDSTEDNPVYKGGLTELLGRDHPITQKVISEGVDALTEEDRDFIRESAAIARVTDRPRSLFMAGGAAVGKSSALKVDPSLKPESAITINADDVKLMLPEYQPQVDAGEKGAASSVHAESSDIGRSTQSLALELGMNVVVDGTGNKSVSDFEGKLRELAGAGYTVDVVVVNLPTDEAMTRAVRRAAESGRYVPTDILRKAHAQVSRNIEALTDADFINTITMFDNEVPIGEPPVRFAEVVDGELTVYDRALLDRFYEKADEVVEREKFDETVGAIQEAEMSKPEESKETMPDNPIPPDRWTYWEPTDWVDYLNLEPVEIVTEDGRLLDDAGRFIRDLTEEEMERRRATAFEQGQGDGRTS